MSSPTLFLTKLLNLKAIVRKNWANQIEYHPWKNSAVLLNVNVMKANIVSWIKGTSGTMETSAGWYCTEPWKKKSSSKGQYWGNLETLIIDYILENNIVSVLNFLDAHSVYCGHVVECFYEKFAEYLWVKCHICK